MFPSFRVVPAGQTGFDVPFVTNDPTTAIPLRMVGQQYDAPVEVQAQFNQFSSVGCTPIIDEPVEENE